MSGIRGSGGVVSRLAVGLLIGVLAGASALLALDTGPTVRVTVPLANVRDQPGPAGKVLFQLAKDQTARLLGSAGAWHEIEDATGRRGYVFGSLVQVVEPPSPRPAPVPAARRPAPVDIDHKAIGCIVAEQFPRLDACFAPEDNVGRAEIHFRALDSDPWYSVPMEKDGPCFSAYMPKPMRGTREVQYYVDVVDRTFVETQQPATAPRDAYHARVVRKEGECAGLGRLAHAVGKVAKPIIVGVARTAAGASDAAALSALGQVLLAGFRPEGVILAATGVAPGAAAGASAGAGAGGGAAGGGLGAGTIAAVGGAVAAVGIGAAVASGGGDDGDSGGGGGGGGGGGTPPPTTINLTGTWTGSMNMAGTFSGGGLPTTSLTCTYSQMRLALTHGGNSISGVATFPSVTCNVPGVAPIASAGGSASFGGTASNGQIRMVFPDPDRVCPDFVMNGSYSNNAINGSTAFACNQSGVNINISATWTATR